MEDNITLSLTLNRNQLRELGRILFADLGATLAPAEVTTPPTGQDRLLTVPEVCDLLGLSRNTVYGWRDQATSPPFVRIGRNLRYRRSDLTRWLDEQASASGRNLASSAQAGSRSSPRRR